MMAQQQQVSMQPSVPRSRSLGIPPPRACGLVSPGVALACLLVPCVVLPTHAHASSTPLAQPDAWLSVPPADAEPLLRVRAALARLGLDGSRLVPLPDSSGAYLCLHDDTLFVKAVRRLGQQSVWTEPQWTQWAAGQGFAPEVLGYDAVDGVLVSRFVAAPELTGLDVRTQPLRGDLLRLMFAVHHRAPPSWAKVRHSDYAAAARAGIAWLPQAAVAHPLDPALLGALCEALDEALRAYRPQPLVRFGDLHAGNLLQPYTEERLYLIDWEGAHVGDVMQDLARFIFTARISATGIEGVWRQYHGLAEAQPISEREAAELVHLQRLVAMADLDYYVYHVRGGHRQRMEAMADRVLDDARLLHLSTLAEMLGARRVRPRETTPARHVVLGRN